MFILFRLVLTSTVLLLLFGSFSFASNFPSQAIVAAEQFVELIDDNDFAVAYEGASELMHLSHSEADWVARVKLSALLVGAVQKRKLISVLARESYPRFPDGEYLLVYFESQRERKQKATEVVLVHAVAGKWQVCTYRLK